MPARQRVKVSGSSGTGYSYLLYDLVDDFPERVGNYIFVRRNPLNGLWHALYAGETGNFDERLTSTSDPRHLCAIEDHNATHILINANGKRRRGRLEEEADIKAKYSPPCNA